MDSEKELNEYEAALIFEFSPYLLRWFTKNSVIDANKLPFKEMNGLYYFEIKELRKLDKKLEGKWPLPTQGDRPNVPVGIKHEIKDEAQYRCPICHTNQGEVAHIDPVAKSYCNHPKNLLFLCPTHHTEYDYGYKPKNVSLGVILHFKNGLKLFRKIQWQLQGELIHTYLGALNSAVSLVNIHKEIKELIPNKDFKKLLSKISGAAVKAGGKKIKNKVQLSPCLAVWPLQ